MLSDVVWIMQCTSQFSKAHGNSLNWQICLINLDDVVVIEKSFHDMSLQSAAGVE